MTETNHARVAAEACAKYADLRGELICLADYLFRGVPLEVKLREVVATLDGFDAATRDKDARIAELEGRVEAAEKVVKASRDVSRNYFLFAGDAEASKRDAATRLSTALAAFDATNTEGGK